MMDWGNGGWGAGEGFVMSTMMVLFLGAIIASVVWITGRWRTERGSSGDEDRADVLLAERFARGEIDGEEFARSRELLHSGR